MSVKFEQDSVKTTVGAVAKDAGGKAATGYLNVRLHTRDVRLQPTDTMARHTSRSSSRTLSEQRCLRPVP